MPGMASRPSGKVRSSPKKPNTSPSQSKPGLGKPNSSGTKPKPSPVKPSNVKSGVHVEDKFKGLSLRSKPKRPTRTGFMYDESMLNYTSLHDENYLDSPDRISCCYDKCRHLGLVKRCIRLKVTMATDADLLTTHEEEYVEKIKSTSRVSDDELISMEHGYHNICMHKNVMECARLAAGAAIEMMKAIVSDRVGNGLAVIRPPGHHATREEGAGLCYFNNVAIAANHCLEKLDINRVLIVDWDVHHGNGTQDLFYKDSRVMYMSIHRYEHGWFWPNLRKSDYDHIGEGEGLGYNLNIPLNKTGMTDGDYLAIFHQLIMPLAMEFNPSAVIVSAGYDCALGCPEGEMKLSPPVFSHLVHKLKSLADGRLAVILEGGYNLESLSESVGYSLRALLDDCCPMLSPTQPPQPELVNTLLNCINVMRPHWKCFKYQRTDVTEKAVNLDSFDSRGPAPFVTGSPAYHELNKETPQPEDVKEKFSEQIRKIVAEHPTRTTTARSSYVYDEGMLKHKCAMDPTHPEKPERIARIHQMLEDYGLLSKCIKLKSRKATKAELSSVHSQKYIAELKALESTKPRDFKELEEKYNSIYLHPDTYSSSLLAAGSLLNIVDSVMTNESRNGFAITRPPGHHAEEGTAFGFCFLNNVPVAAKYAQEKHGAKRIAIIDWDVHHGNGTQHMFESDNSVLYISLHRYDNSFFFPGSEDGNYDKFGKGKGVGYNVNIPFNRKWIDFRSSRPPGDPEYIAAFQQVVMPICYEFAPDLVFISAGFDAAKGDPLGGYSLTPGGYAHMTHMLSSLADGRLILVLEGGYNLNSISESFSSCVDIMMGGTPPRIDDTEPDSSAVSTIQNVIAVHKAFWKSLCCDAVLPLSKKELEQDKESTEEKTDSLVELLVGKLKAMAVEEGSATKENSSDAKPSTPAAKSDESKGTAETLAAGEVAAGAAAAGEAASGAAGAGAMDESMEMFAVTPLSWCAHIEDNLPLPGMLDTSSPCLDCGHVGENWVCLTCYKVYCSRYQKEHMLFHSIASDHKMVLSFADLSVWCYACDSYIHHPDLIPMKNSAHLNKFGVTYHTD
ncbi:histone deacetylase 6-like [Watersipora subatra]|uniref:histone deacetylase 6-like n=1 Tax=Watersipora subatra TaxID=2589382 RepID=UPI00355C10EC